MTWSMSLETKVTCPSRLYLFLIKDKLKRKNGSESWGGNVPESMFFRFSPPASPIGSTRAGGSRNRGDESIE